MNWLVSSFNEAVVVVVVGAVADEDGCKLTEHCQQNLSQRFNLRQVLTGVNVIDMNWLVSSFNEAVVVVVAAVADEDGCKLTEHCQQNLSQGLNLHQVQTGVNIIEINSLVSSVTEAVVVVVVAAEDGYKLTEHCQHLSQGLNLHQVETGVNVTEINSLVSSLLLLLLKMGISSLSTASTCPRASTYTKLKLVLTLLKLIN